MQTWYTRGLLKAHKHQTWTIIRWPFCVPTWLDNGDLTMPNNSYLNHSYMECSTQTQDGGNTHDSARSPLHSTCEQKDRSVLHLQGLNKSQKIINIYLHYKWTYHVSQYIIYMHQQYRHSWHNKKWQQLEIHKESHKNMRTIRHGRRQFFSKMAQGVVCKRQSTGHIHSNRKILHIWWRGGPTITNLGK